MTSKKVELSSKTKINDLLDEYPFLIDFLPTLSPKYKKLKNPIMRKTLAKIATLDTVAKMGDMKVRALITEIKNAIEEKTNAEEAGEELSDDKIDVLKDIIKDLHKGVDMVVLKKRFSVLINDVTPKEISLMEQRLIEEGMPEEEVKRLCDVHVEVFKNSLDEQEVPDEPPGHPVHTFMEENRVAEEHLANLVSLIDKLGPHPKKEDFKKHKKAIGVFIEKLSEIEKHYQRKENQLFPMLEAHEVSGPSQVMWVIHDEIRAFFKKVRILISDYKAAEVVMFSQELAKKISDMIYKEEHILFPMSLETLDHNEWVEVKKGEKEIGYAWVKPGKGWPSEKDKLKGKLAKELKDDKDHAMDTGILSLEQINLMLIHLPVDITFIDENDHVAYYSGTKERIFPRSSGIIGRKVQKCHPSKSVKVVNKILKEFKDGNKDVAEFWFHLDKKFIHIRYLAIRDDKGVYKGVIEVSQDVTEIRKLEFERKLLDWE